MNTHGATQGTTEDALKETEKQNKTTLRPNQHLGKNRQIQAICKPSKWRERWRMEEETDLTQKAQQGVVAVGSAARLSLQVEAAS